MIQCPEAPASAQDQRHDPGEDRRDPQHAEGAEEPLPLFILGVDIGLHLLRPRDGPGLGVTHPPLVDQKAVHEVQHEANI